MRPNFCWFHLKSILNNYHHGRYNSGKSLPWMLTCNNFQHRTIAPATILCKQESDMRKSGWISWWIVEKSVWPQLSWIHLNPSNIKLPQPQRHAQNQSGSKTTLPLRSQSFSFRGQSSTDINLKTSPKPNIQHRTWHWIFGKTSSKHQLSGFNLARYFSLLGSHPFPRREVSYFD